VLPLLGAFVALFYLCLPTAVGVLRTSTLRIWDFDLRQSLFVYLEVGVATCSIVCAVVGGRLLKKLWRSREHA
jgi:hypothetical protein